MYNALWLFFALPQWYFQNLLAPFSGGLLSTIPTVGISSLAIGLFVGLIQRRPDLFLFLILVAVSQGLVALAGFMRGMLSYEASSSWLLVFLGLQVIAAGYLVIRLRGARWAAAALAVFAISYALFAAVIARMAFIDVWL